MHRIATLLIRTLKLYAKNSCTQVITFYSMADAYVSAVDANRLCAQLQYFMHGSLATGEVIIHCSFHTITHPVINDNTNVKEKAYLELQNYLHCSDIAMLAPHS